MASPGYIATCCLGNSSGVSSDINLKYILLQEKVVSIISLTFSLFGLLGIAIILLPWKHSVKELSWKQRRLLIGPNLNCVINCLVTAGVLGNIGIVLRSSVWLDGWYPEPNDMDYHDFKHIFCILSSVWVQYFFLCTIFWHLVYGLEAYMVSQGKASSKVFQNFIGWVLPAAFCIVGTWVAYQPSLRKCGARHPLDKGMLYFLMLSPVVIVFLLLTALLYRANRAVKRSLIHHFGKFTSTERVILDAIQIKFFLIITSFCVSWLPNIVTGIFVNVLDGKSQDMILILMVLMSVLNPVQVLLDAMVLWGWPPDAWCCLVGTRYHSYLEIPNSGNLQGTNPRSRRRTRSTSRSDSESDPLISFRRNPSR